jgi:FAD/FMN-containing dehydrogenase
MIATLSFPALGNAVTAQRRRTVRVRSAEQLRRALRESQDCALTLDASAMCGVLGLDRERGCVEVQPALPWGVLASYLGAHGITMGVFAECLGAAARVGETVSENAAGPDGTPIVAHVQALTLATPDGELRRVSRESGGALFGLAVGGHGAFGFLYSVTLRLESLARAATCPLEPVALEFPPPLDSGLVGESEVLVPPEALDAYLAEVRALAEEQRVALREIRVRRHRPEAETFLRWAVRDWAGLALRFELRTTLGAAVRAAEIRRLLLGTALAHGGSFPLRACAEATRAQLEDCYPAIGAFLAEKRRYDPAGRLSNAWLRRIAGVLRSGPAASRWSD